MSGLTTTPPRETGALTRWAILTGEYPPQPGGVADYTEQVAAGLVAAGDAVTVYAPPHDRGRDPDRPGVTVVRLPDRFGLGGLLCLDAALARGPRPDRVLVQYTPHAFGYKAMNLPFAAWVAARAGRFGPVWVLFHEVNYPFGWRPKPATLAAAHRLMARLVAGAADRVFVTTTAWEERLRRFCPRAKPAEWLPVPCNVGTTADPAAVEAVRARHAPGPDARLVGHFGTFGVWIADLLGPVLARVLRAGPAVRVLLVGRGSDGFRDRFAAGHPDLVGRVSAAGELPAGAVAAHLRACDLLLQPYPDGITTRRTSGMAGLANGVPVASNLGPLSEPLWADLGWAGLAPGPDPDALAAAAATVLALPPAARAELGRRGAALYHDRFSAENTIARLRGPASPPGHADRPEPGGRARPA
jgi:glycosyltransferase involved in cell wall biosynthesis